MKSSKYTIILICMLAFIPVILTGQQTVTLTPTGDSWIRICTNPNYSNIINTNYSTIIYNHSDEWTIGGYRLASRMLMKFDLDVIPEDVDIISANLSLYAQYPQPTDDYKHRNFTITNNSGYKLNACYLERVTGAWNVNTVTWANQPSTTSTNAVTLTESLVSNQNYTGIDVTQMVTDMVNNRATSHGIMMRLINEAKYARMAFCSVNHSNPGLHPRLEITYSLQKDKIETGEQHCLLLKSDGSIWAWGNNEEGQFGNGTTSSYNDQPQPTNNGNNWVKISSTYFHTLAIKNDGTLWAWGRNINNQLGIDSSAYYISTPMQVGTDNNWKEISTGGTFSLAIKTDGTMWAWGDNSKGQLGCGGCSSSPIPIQVGTDNTWKIISAGQNHALAIKNDGTLWGWGDNEKGKVGNGDYGQYEKELSPVPIASPTTWAHISAGQDHSFGIQTNGTLWGWGLNSLGQLGIADGSYTDHPLPTNIAPSVTWVEVTTGAHHTIAKASDGNIWAWGYDYNGQLGDGTPTLKQDVPTVIPEAFNCIDFEAAFDFTMILKPDQQYCGTGSNDYYQLGDQSFGRSTYNCYSYETSSSSSSLKSTKVSSDNTNSTETPDSELAKANLTKSKLGTCYPNPAKTNTTISFFVVPEAVDAKIVIQSLSSGYNKEYPILDRGNSYLNIDVQNLPSGVYSYYLVINSMKADVKKFVIVK